MMTGERKPRLAVYYYGEFDPFSGGVDRRYECLDDVVRVLAMLCLLYDVVIVPPGALLEHPLGLPAFERLGPLVREGMLGTSASPSAPGPRIYMKERLQHRVEGRIHRRSGPLKPSGVIELQDRLSEILPAQWTITRDVARQISGCADHIRQLCETTAGTMTTARKVLAMMHATSEQRGTPLPARLAPLPAYRPALRASPTPRAPPALSLFPPLPRYATLAPMKLPIAEFEAVYRPTGDLRLPYHSGSLLRGVLGRALRQTGCANRCANPDSTGNAPPDAPPDTPCRAACRRPGACTYSRLFDPPLPTPLPHRLLRGATEAPPPLLPLIPRPGETRANPLVLGVRVLGALPHDDAERLLAALHSMAALRLGDAEADVAIEHVRRRHELDRTLEIAPGEPASGQLRITFETPAWLTLKGRLHTADDLDFRALFRHVYRRLTTLAALYGELRPEDDARFPELDRLAASVRTASARLRALRWERHSWEREVRHPMTGLVGTLLFEGPVGVFRPLPEAAALTFIGKCTSHGLGRIHIDAHADRDMKGATSTHQ